MKKFSFFCSLLVVALVASCKKDDPAPTAPPPNPTPQQDSIAPVITLSTASSITHTLNSPFTAPTATAYDSTDGDLTAYISINSNVDVNLTGAYFVVYTVMDSDSNLAQQVLTVTVVNSAQAIAGTYTSHDSCQVTASFNYNATVLASSTVNGAITIINFGGFGTAVNVSASVSGSSIAFPAQSLASSASLLSASGTIISTSPRAFDVYYSWTDGVSTEICISNYRE